MIQPIMRDVLFLGRKSEPATEEDKQTGTDLMDTLHAHRQECVGMAANMIGVRKRIIIVNMGFMNVVMYNPVITAKRGKYQTEEGCLSLIGTRPCTRYKEIEVEYYDSAFKKQKMTLKDFQAQIVQHECDHLEGIII